MRIDVIALRAIPAALGATLALAAGPVSAAADGELWEVSSQMSMPGLPAGMGAHTQQVCTEKGDPSKAATRNNSKCKVTDRKQSGNRMTMTIVCPEGKSTFETTYNSAHTEYDGRMVTQTQQGEMTMTMHGRKLGSCDATAARNEREQRAAAAKSQMEQSQRQANQQVAASQQQQIKQCDAAVQTMDVRKLGVFSQCDRQPATCDAYSQSDLMKPVATACKARGAEYCKRYQTVDGFLKANGSEDGAAFCHVTLDGVKGKLCPSASKSENLAFLGRYCLAEAKPIAEQHCAGRDYTSAQNAKYADFCVAYLSQASLERSGSSSSSRSSSSSSSSSAQPNPADAAGEAVNQGINKLKGLFGR